MNPKSSKIKKKITKVIIRVLHFGVVGYFVLTPFITNNPQTLRDYVLYSIINGQCDQNEEIELYFAKNGTTDLDSVCIDRWSKNREQSVQSTYALDGLVVGDVITVQLNTNNDDVDLENRRLLLQTWG